MSTTDSPPALRFSANVTLLCPNQDAASFAPMLAAHGFEAVEYQRLDPTEAERHAPHLAAASLDVALMNLDVGDFARGGPGLSGLQARSDDFARALERGCADVAALKAKLVHVGPARVGPGVSRRDCQRQLRDNLQRARDRLVPLGAALTLEALNSRDYPDLLVRSPEDALELFDAIGGEHLFLQYDIYHAARDGRDVLTDLSAFHGRIGHVQFADHPGRHEPGTGALPLQAYFAALRARGHGGFVGAEYVPLRAVTETFDWLAHARRVIGGTGPTSDTGATS